MGAGTIDNPSTMSAMLTVCIESPLAGDFPRNIAYARAALRYCLMRGVSPYASHLLLTQVYDDLDPAQREAGIAAGLVMGNLCDVRWYFTDFGMSDGMQRAFEQTHCIQPWRTVKLGDGWEQRYGPTPTPWGLDGLMRF